MAGDWIKVRTNLWDDPRVARLVDMTDSSEAAVIGGLYWLWATADQHSINGVLPGLSVKGIDRKTGVPGLGQALVQVGWLEDHAEGVCVTRFDEHNGSSAKQRAMTAKRVAKHKKATAVTLEDIEGNAPSVTESLPERDLDIDIEKEKDSSVAIATDGAAVKSAEDMTKAELWGAGKSLLQAAGIPKAQCGSFVGKLVKDYTDAIVVEAVRATVLTQPADPIEYLKATCQRLAGQRKPVNKQEAIEQRNRSVAQEWAGEDIHAAV